MSPQTILILFFLFFAVEYFISTILTIMNLHNSLANRNSVPSFISHVLSIKRYDKTVQYTQRRGRFSLLSSAISTIFTAIVIILKVPALIYQAIAALGWHPYWEGIAFLLMLTALSSLLSLPFSLYSQFIIEEEFGFNKMTFRLYLSDMIKGAVLSIVLFIPLLLGLFLFMDKSGSLWWLYGFIFFAGFQLLITLLYPLVIAPLFNKFSELEDGDLKKRLFDLAEKTSFKTKGIFMMDGSRRSAHSNAYFTGFGKARRIVLFDTLLKQLNDDEIEAVLAHEIGHFKKKHIIKGLVFSLLSSLGLFYALSLLIDYKPLYEAFGFETANLPSLIVILSFCLGPLSFLIKPLFSLRSRRNEYEADRYAAGITGDHKPLASALIALGKENLSNLTPHRLYSAFHYSHPALSERIAAMEKPHTK